MTTAWERLTELSNNTPGSALVKFNAISGVGIGTVIVNAYEISYTIPNYMVEVVPYSSIELSSLNLDISVSSTNPISTEVNLQSPNVLVDINPIEIEVD